MKIEISDNEAWETIRRCENNEGRIVRAEVKVRIRGKGLSFLPNIKNFLSEVLKDESGRLLLRWNIEEERGSSNFCVAISEYRDITSARLLAVVRRRYELISALDFGVVSVDCTIEYPRKNEKLIFRDLRYPPSGKKYTAEKTVIRPFKLITMEGTELLFSSESELMRFLEKNPFAKTYMWDDESGSWVPWAYITREGDFLVVSIPSLAGVQRITINLHTGEIHTESSEAE
ncbi:MAG: hypothetical protein ACTSXJ_09025 [Candidatus Baldrarchaeia archaeon]